MMKFSFKKFTNINYIAANRLPNIKSFQKVSSLIIHCLKNREKEQYNEK